MDRPRAWSAAIGIVVVLWLVLVVRLMIADVWDETNGMLLFSASTMSLAEKVHFVATHPLGFWRPLPTVMVAVILHVVRDFDVSWRILRGINAMMLLAALALFLDAVRRWSGRSQPRDLVFAVAMLFSGSALITAGWYANVFDASALMLIALGAALLSRGRPLEAGIALGIAFFCKETAVLSLPFLVMLLVARRIDLRAFLRAAVPAAVMGLVYFLVRSRIIAFGSTADIHQFQPELFLPSAIHLAESFWRQTLKESGVTGYLWLALSIAALRRPRVIAAALGFLAAVAVIYWGMFWETQDGIVIHHLNFAGRLYLIPVTLLLLMLTIEKQTAAVALLCIPIAFGAFTTWRDHARFQRTYRTIYAEAKSTREKPLTVHFPIKPLEDTVRGVRIGDIPDAQLRLDAESGRLAR